MAAAIGLSAPRGALEETAQAGAVGLCAAGTQWRRAGVGYAFTVAQRQRPGSLTERTSVPRGAGNATLPLSVSA